MKRILKALGGMAAVMTLVCLLSTPVQARTSFTFNFGFGGYYPVYGRAYYPVYYSGAPPAYYYCQRPVYRYYYSPPVYYYSGGYYYCR
jgi:hypothetical protein